eukprot:COSAG06_NODE_19_length_34432_cov_10.651832_11_plen_81_part_00
MCVEPQWTICSQQLAPWAHSPNHINTNPTKSQPPSAPPPAWLAAPLLEGGDRGREVAAALPEEEGEGMCRSMRSSRLVRR